MFENLCLVVPRWCQWSHHNPPNSTRICFTKFILLHDNISRLSSLVVIIKSTTRKNGSYISWIHVLHPWRNNGPHVLDVRFIVAKQTRNCPTHNKPQRCILKCMFAVCSRLHCHLLHDNYCIRVLSTVFPWLTSQNNSVSTIYIDSDFCFRYEIDVFVFL